NSPENTATSNEGRQDVIEEKYRTLAIDFGTTNSVMTWWNPSKKMAEVIPNSQGELQTPSVVYYAPEGVLVGRAAEKKLTDADLIEDEEKRKAVLGSIFCSIKRFIGNGTMYILPDGRQLSPVEIAAEIFRKLKHDAEKTLFNGPIKRALVTFPASFNSTQKKGTFEAAKLAGFETIEMLEEPVAAAMGYLSLNEAKDRGMLVYDLGGGTFDLVYVRRDKKKGFYCPLPPAGDSKFGGNELDQLIYQLCEKHVQKEFSCNLPTESKVSQAMLLKCRKSKEALSNRPKVTTTMLLGNRPRRLVIERAPFENLLQSIVDSTFRRTKDIILKIKKKRFPLNSIVITGESTRVPFIATNLKKLFKEKAVQKAHYIDHAVAIGAAVASIPAKGALKIETNADNAMVYLKLKLNKHAPIVIADLPPGNANMWAELGGHQTDEQIYTTEAGQTTIARLDLAKLSKPGQLTVYANPSSARIRFENSRKKYRPGLYLPAGPHTIEVSKDNFESYKEKIFIKANQHHQMEVKLYPLRGMVRQEPFTGMEFVWVPGGCYQMGSGDWDNDGYYDEKPVHKVHVDGFWLGKYQVTQAQWHKVMGSNPARFQRGENYPVDNVSWTDAKIFIQKLMGQKKDNYQFRLPTEAEWEYACRSGGKSEKYAGGKNIEKVAWYEANSGDSTHPVGQKEPNGLGLYDMCGNVWEWCEDIYNEDAYRFHTRNNPINTEDGTDRVLRGGGWYNKAGYCRSAIRFRNNPNKQLINFGFRLAATLISG
ncbi:MAG: Hsp70 family protein, partial [Desulfobacteraceae bacterium]